MAMYNDYQGHPEEPDGHTLYLRAHFTGSPYSPHDLFGGINLHICCVSCEGSQCFWYCFSGISVQPDLLEHIMQWHPNLGAIEFECDLSDHPPDFFDNIFQFIQHLRVYRGQVDDN